MKKRTDKEYWRFCMFWMKGQKNIRNLENEKKVKVTDLAEKFNCFQKLVIRTG